MFKVVVHPRLEKLVEKRTIDADQLDLEDAIRAAGWDPKDPGVGGAVLGHDGREIVSPAKFEEPADIEAGQDMFAVMERRIMQKLRAGLFTGEDVVDETPEEALDFNVTDGTDVQYVSGFEVEMADEFPHMPTPAPRPGSEPEGSEASEVRPAVDRADGSALVRDRVEDRPDLGSERSERPSPPVGGDEGGSPKRARAVPKERDHL